MLGSLWRNPKSIRYTGSLIALYLHFGPFSEYVAGRIRGAIEEADVTRRDQPALLASG